MDEKIFLAGIGAKNMTLGGYTSRWGSCAGSDGYRLFPIGIDGKVSITQFPDEDKVPVTERYAVTSKSIDVGAGNFLNVRMLNCIDASKSVYGPDGSGVHIPSEPPMKDGPACWNCYFEGLEGQLNYGFVALYDDGSPNWDKGRVPIPKQDYYDFGKTFNNCTFSFVIRTQKGHANQTDKLDAFFKELEWTDKVIYRSPLFNNRSHHYVTDCLQLVVVQLKD